MYNTAAKITNTPKNLFLLTHIAVFRPVIRRSHIHTIFIARTMVVTMCCSSVEIVGNDSAVIISRSVWSRETEGEVNNPDRIQSGNTIDRHVP